ncbi:MAG: hypothetical protein ING88_02550 [Cytophagales bacterium]|nr:hypothetical protein [Cytophagales bacterium]
MKRKILSGKDLIKLGYPEGRAVGIAINTVLKHLSSSLGHPPSVLDTE